MITVAVCSINQQQLFEFTKNVADTIGCIHEVIAINNARDKNGICSVYNKLTAMAAYDTICFCHEDVFFTKENWGKQLIKILWDNVSEVGLVGVAGAIYKSKYPVSWIDVPPDYYRNNIVQQTKNGLVYNTKLDDGISSQVEVIDGCFIAGKKKIFNDIPWNDKHLGGFHLYDMDISLRIGQTHKVVVANGIELIHQSEGSFDNAWFVEAQKFCMLHKNELPLDSLLQTVDEKKEADYYSLIAFCRTLLRLKRPSIETGKQLLYLMIKFPFRKNSWIVLKMFIKSVLQ